MDTYGSGFGTYRDSNNLNFRTNNEKLAIQIINGLDYYYINNISTTFICNEIVEPKTEPNQYTPKSHRLGPVWTDQSNRPF